MTVPEKLLVPPCVARGTSKVKIEHALARIKQGVYGYFDITGKKIGLERLKTMPLTTLSIEAQEQIERNGIA